MNVPFGMLAGYLEKKIIDVMPKKWATCLFVSGSAFMLLPKCHAQTFPVCICLINPITGDKEKNQYAHILYVFWFFHFWQCSRSGVLQGRRFCWIRMIQMYVFRQSIILIASKPVCGSHALYLYYIWPQILYGLYVP